MSDHLVLKGGTYHAIMYIPDDASHLFGGRRKITKSLKTGNKAEANVKKLEILAAWKELVRRAREGVDEKTFANQILHDALVQEFVNKTKKEHAHKIVNEEIKADWSTFANSLFSLKREVAELLNDEQYLAYSEEIQNLMNEALDGRLRDIGSVELYKRMSVISDAVVEKKEEIQLIEKGYSSKQIAEFKNVRKSPELYLKNRTLYTHDRIEKFREHQKNIRDISEKTIDTQISKLKSIKKYIEENELTLSFDTISNFLNQLELSTKTKKQYVYAGNSFHKWAVKYDSNYKNAFKDTINPFEKHDFPILRKGRKVVAKRLAFEFDDIKAIYDRAKEKKSDTLANLIKIASYTGCRIEEICKLKPEHIVFEQGIRSLWIDEAKSDAGIRKIPIHPEIEGLIDNLSKNNDYLIESSGGNKYDIRSDPHSKAFGRLKKEMGYDERYVFHSIRKTVITKMQHEDVPALVLSSLVGHETGTITFDVYSEGASAKQKLEAIKKLNYKF